MPHTRTGCTPPVLRLASASSTSFQVNDPRPSVRGAVQPGLFCFRRLHRVSFELRGYGTVGGWPTTLTPPVERRGESPPASRSIPVHVRAVVPDGGGSTAMYAERSATTFVTRL